MNEPAAQQVVQAAQRAIDEGEHRTAYALLCDLIERGVRDAAAFELLGWVVYGRGSLLGVSDSLALARAHLDEALALDASRPKAHLYLGLVLHLIGDLSSSEDHFRRAIELTDEPSLAHAVFAEDLLWHSNRYIEAEEQFLLALAEDPGNTVALRDFARMLTSHGRVEEAEPLLRAAFLAEPDSRFTQRAVEELREALDDGESAASLETAMKRQPGYPSQEEALLILRKQVFDALRD